MMLWAGNRSKVFALINLPKRNCVYFEAIILEQRVQYNKTRESVEIYTTTANKLPHQKGG